MLSFNYLCTTSRLCKKKYCLELMAWVFTSKTYSLLIQTYLWIKKETISSNLWTKIKVWEHATYCSDFWKKKKRGCACLKCHYSIFLSDLTFFKHLSFQAMLCQCYYSVAGAPHFPLLTWLFAMLAGDPSRSGWAAQPDASRTLFLWKEKCLS